MHAKHESRTVCVCVDRSTTFRFEKYKFFVNLPKFAMNLSDKLTIFLFFFFQVTGWGTIRSKSAAKYKPFGRII